MKKDRKIKVVEVIPTLHSGGAENVTKFICKYLDRSKFDLTLFCFYKSPKYNWPKDLNIIFLHKKKGIDLNLITRLKNNLNKIQPDIIHCHNLNSLLYVIFARTLFHRPRIVQTIHNDLEKHSNSIFWKIIFIIFKIYTVNLSPKINRCLQSRKENFNIANGIELNKFSKPRTNVEVKQIVNIGRLEKQKNHIFLIKAFGYIAKHDKNLKLIIAGQGTLEKKIKKEVKKLHLQSRVKIIPKHVDSAKLFKKSDYYISSSFWEGMPLVIIEALASGLAVFSTPAGATEDLIKNNYNGFIYRGKTPEDLADLFVKESQDKKKIQKIRKNSIKSSTYFSAQIMTKKYEKVFKALVAKHQ
ncbi:MAG: glycosyltransferase [bacterium]